MLKGGSLLYAMNGLEARPTVDVDFMADRISRDRDFLAHVFQEILGIVCDEDGVSFDVNSIKLEPITVEKKYPGTRFYFTAHMDTIAYNMSVDIGFGDVVTPYPTTIDFPLLLPRHSICEHTGIFLGDCCCREIPYDDRPRCAQQSHERFLRLLPTPRQRDLSDDTLYDAIKATFDNRGLTYNPELQLFTESFATDAARIVRWKAFLKKIQWKETLDFKTVMEVIKERLQPMAERYWGK